eukprot:TRINITY_DN234_c0_g1_i1.p1 TRINITY_DN234_c0_g1~~TRINITY_DN234_c0_g1_i1.p1  ORF type:complete len:357 (+),score=106.47 TRINITY_DN234_c0_g1_i1:132-1202(+)
MCIRDRYQRRVRENRKGNMATMKAVVVTEYKAHTEQDFTPKEVPRPDCAPGMVLVRNKAASINPIDYKVVGGHLADAGWPQPNPLTPGYDLAGTVEAIGDTVDGVGVGDDVFACNWGSAKGTHMNNHADEGQPIAGALAEYVLIPAAKLSTKPAGVSFEEASAVALVGLTAMQALETLIGPDYNGKKVLVLGGAGAVGYVACQLAKLGGATVFTTASERTMEYVKGTGADVLINYREEKWEEQELLRGVDGVFDTTGEEGGFAKAKTILKEDGAFVTIASFDAGFDPAAHAPLRFASFQCLTNDVAQQDKLAGMLADKSLKINVESTFAFSKEGIDAAFAAQAGGKSMGKNVVVFG